MNDTMIASVAGGGGGICGMFDSFSSFLTSAFSGGSAQVTVIFFLFESMLNVGSPE